MAYIITLKTPQMKIYVREPLVGGEWTREEWEKRGGAALEPKGDFETMNEQVADDQARKMVEEIRAMMEAEMEKAGAGPGGRKVTIPPFMGPGFKIPGGH